MPGSSRRHRHAASNAAVTTPNLEPGPRGNIRRAGSDRHQPAPPAASPPPAAIMHGELFHDVFLRGARAGVGNNDINLFHLGDGLPFGSKIFQCIQQPERLRHANQRFQRALAVGLEFAQRAQRTTRPSPIHALVTGNDALKDVPRRECSISAGVDKEKAT